MNRWARRALSVMAVGLQRFPLFAPTAWLAASRYLRKANS